MAALLAVGRARLATKTVLSFLKVLSDSFGRGRLGDEGERGPRPVLEGYSRFSNVEGAPPCTILGANDAAF